MRLRQTKMKTPATLIAVVDGKDTVLHRKEWIRKVWTTLIQDAEYSKLFGSQDGKLHAGECFNCKKNGVLRVIADKVHPEVVHIVYYCVLCKAEVSDVLD